VPRPQALTQSEAHTLRPLEAVKTRILKAKLLSSVMKGLTKRDLGHRKNDAVDGSSTAAAHVFGCSASGSAMIALDRDQRMGCAPAVISALTMASIDPWEESRNASQYSSRPAQFTNAGCTRRFPAGQRAVGHD
jgi:hypothetical protein